MFESVAVSRRPRGLVPPIDPATLDSVDPAAAERVDRIRRILDAAVALADEGGFEAVRARELCDRANVSMGTLYRCFESKEEILLHAFSDDFEVLERHFEQRPIAGPTSIERVDTFFRIATAGFSARPDYARAIVGAMSSGQGKAVQRAADLTARIMSVIHCAWTGETYRAPTDGVPCVPAVHPIARMLGHVWFAMLVGWKGALYNTDDVLAEMHASAALASR